MSLQTALIRIRAATPSALLWACSASALTAWLWWQVGRTLATSLLKAAILFAATLGGIMLIWHILPGMSFPNQKWLTIRAATPEVRDWFQGSLLFSSFLLVGFGVISGRRAHAAWQTGALLGLANTALDAGIALSDRRGRTIYINERGREWLLPSPVGKRNSPFLRQELRDSVRQVSQKKRPVTQVLPISEGVRLAVQMTCLRRNRIGVTAQRIGSETGNSRFYEQFLRRIVHDMRNPLAGIIAHAGNLRAEESITQDALQQTAQIIENEAQRLTRLVDSLLFDARLSFVPPALAPLDLVDVAEDILYQYEERATQERKYLVLEMPDSAPYHGDRDLLTRALSNLVDNSLKYSKEGALIQIRLEHDESASGYRLAVRDSGSGIPFNVLPDKIFEPLVRAHAKESGSGLGLSIVKRVAELHGGTARAESVLGKGTTITLWLPN
ncbi:MAG: hypothetical protein OHK0023_20730 [Anaerolineae bacterium]